MRQADRKLLNADGEVVGQVASGPGHNTVDELIRALCEQTVGDGHSVLVFSAAKWVRPVVTSGTATVQTSVASCAPTDVKCCC